MSYAQKNYQDKQGINGKYTIAQIGCFITAFCNLLERFGQSIDPPTINAYLRDHGTYIDVDDGIRDDVGYGTVSAVNGNVVVSSTGAGAPTQNNAIVKFYYRSKNTGQMTTHFCLVADYSRKLILDSWDGVVKNWDVYGAPLGYATYQLIKPQTVTPPAPAGGEPVISNVDNEYFRWNKLFYQIRGRNASREEFVAAAVGRNWLAAMETLSDSPEADLATSDGVLGAVARTNNWQQQITDLLAQAEILKKNPTQEQFDALKTQLQTCSESMTISTQQLAAIQKQREEEAAANNNVVQRIGDFLRKYLHL